MRTVARLRTVVRRSAAATSLETFLCVALALAMGPYGLGAQQLSHGQYALVDIQYGATLYSSQCVRCHNADGAGVSNVNLRSGHFRRATTDPELSQLISTGIPERGMPGVTFTRSELTALVAFLRNMNTVDAGSVTLGDVERGRSIFEGKGNCLQCHMVNDRGSLLAPDLSDIGSRRTPSTLERNLLDPTAVMIPINRPVRAVMRNGDVINGRRVNEDTYTVQLIDDEANLVSLAKEDLRALEVSTTSPMPTYRDVLNDEERSDLVTYLLSLRGM